MSRHDRLRFAALAILVAATLVYAVRVAARAHVLVFEIGRAKAGVPGPELLERLARADAEVELVWYASPRAEMPAEYRPLEGAIVDLFRALERESGGRVTGRIVDPTRDPALASHLAALGLAPFRARRIERDAIRERSLWSSLRIAYGPHGAATIAGLGPEHLSGLQALIIAELDQLEHPRRPRIAVAAPDEYGELRRALRGVGDILDSDFDASASLPAEADLFFWIDPARATPAHLSALEGFLAGGKSAVIAGSRWQATFAGAGTDVPSTTGASVEFRATGFPADALLPHFGLIPYDAALFEARAEAAGPLQPSATHLVRAIGRSQDFRALARQPGGTLLFAAPTAFGFDARRLAEQDLVATALASSSESSFLYEPRAGTTALSALQAAADTRYLGAQPLLALLAPVDPWRGSLVFAAASTPFADEFFRHEAFAHAALTRLLVETLASNERLARQRAAIALPARLPELSGSERAWWRAAVVIGVPLVIALVALARLRGARAGQRGTRQRTAAALALRLAGAAAIALVLARLAPNGAALDLSRAGANDLAPETRSVLARCVPGLAPVKVELLFSENERLPPEFRPRIARARELARRIAGAVEGIEIVDRAPADEDALPAFRVTSQDEEVTTVRRIHSTIRISAGGRREDLALPDLASFERLEFRIAFALDRLSRGSPVRIAVATDVPQVAPAEALFEYQKKGLFAPSEGDVYSQARAWLAAHDFELAWIDPARPAIPEDARALVWLQPRRDARALLAETARLLERGGAAFLAAQHYVVRSRQRQADDLELALWPEPQFCDLERYYFPRLGIEMPREVIFDELAGTVDVETRLERAPGTFVLERERATSPVLVRAVASNFAHDEPIVAGLSDLLFAFGNRLTWDAGTLARHSIRARPLVSSSERAWSFAWSGGDLPAQVLEPPRAGSRTVPIGRQTLAAYFEGEFPGPTVDPELAAFVDPQSEAGASARAKGSGRLVWVGCSEMFKNGRLHLPGYDHAGFLLASVAHLALEPDLAAILARRTIEPGFDWVAPSARITLRALVIGAAPLVLVMFGVVLRSLRARTPVRIVAHSPTGGAALRGA